MWQRRIERIENWESDGSFLFLWTSPLEFLITSVIWILLHHPRVFLPNDKSEDKFNHKHLSDYLKFIYKLTQQFNISSALACSCFVLIWSLVGKCWENYLEKHLELKLLICFVLDPHPWPTFPNFQCYCVCLI